MALLRSGTSVFRRLLCSSQLLATSYPAQWLAEDLIRSDDSCARRLQSNQAANLFISKPHSLFHHRIVDHTPAIVESSPVLKSVLSLMGYYSRKSDLAEGATILYSAITELLRNDKVYEVFGLDKSKFMSGYMILSLHVWLVVCRMKGERSPDAKYVLQEMYNTFQQDVERRVYQAGVEMHLKKWVRKLEGIFYGTSVTYDKALRGEGTTLPDALLKNVYNNDILHRQHAQLLARYLIRELECLRETPLEDVLKGQVQFSLQQVLPPLDVEAAGQAAGGGSPEQHRGAGMLPSS